MLCSHRWQIQLSLGLGKSVNTGEQIYQILSFNEAGTLPTMITVCAEQVGLVYDLATNQAVNEGE